MKAKRTIHLQAAALLLGLLPLLGTAAAYGQMSDDEFRVLEERSARENWSWQVRRTEASKRPLSELCGLVEPPGWQNYARFVPVKSRAKLGLPAAFDWRSQPNGLPPVRNQGSCGSCWAFASVGALECNIQVKDGITENLSEQWLVSCNQSGSSCGGGWFAHDYHLKVGGLTDPYGQNGAPYESDFPYVAADVACSGPYPHHYWIEDWAYIGSGSGIPAVDEIKQAILTYGPISVGVYVDSAFSAYGGGIFTNNSDRTINHAVVLVGWDDNGGANSHWILRNSWGSSWGESGYMRIKYGCNRVGYGACYVEYEPADLLRISPSAGFTAVGPEGGPFTPGCQAYTLSNSSAGAVGWTARKTANWIDLSSSSGTLAAGAKTNVNVCVNENANGLSGGYYDTLVFSNTATGIFQTRMVNLRAGQIDYFTENFDTTGNDLDYQQFTFTPDASASRYTVCRAAAASFPTTLTGGTNVSLGDDGFATVTLGGGQTVRLYGIVTNRLYVGANGYITFGSSDTTYSESLVNHFNRPRVSALFDDLNPGSSGTIHIRQTADRLAVTYQNVTEYGVVNQNNAQVELFFDGRIRITYLRVDLSDGLAGLSEGQGLPVDFLESDLTSYPACGSETGSVRAFIIPAEAVSASARWQVDGGGWEDTGDVVSGLPVGPHTVGYNALANWTKPPDQSVTVYQNQITAVTGAYVFTSADLGPAVERPAMTWQTGGHSIWFAQAATTHDGKDAAQSGSIGDGGQSWMQTVVTGPCAVSFWWKVSSSSAGSGRGDYLACLVDGVEQPSAITGEVDWVRQEILVSSGNHTVRWAYVKNASDSAGVDAGWVDEMATETLVNLALASRGSTITGNNGADWGLLIDGVTAGYTAASGFGYTYWKDAANAPGSMSLDLKGLCTISQLRLLLWNLDSRYYRYRIEASANGSTWSTIVNRTTGNWQGWQDIAFSPAIQARYLRLTGTYNSANKGFHVVEWEVYGIPPVPAIETSTDSVSVPEGSTAAFQARLTTAPVNPTTVTVARVGGDADITVQSGALLVFTPANWNTYQTATLAAAEDADETADAATIRCSSPGLANQDVTATERENDGISNLALASRGSTITGNNGAGWGLLIDGVTAGYTAATGFGYTYWKDMANAPGSMTLDLKALCTINQTRLLLWNLDSRYYRYRIEASANGSTWSTIVNRTTGNWQGWQDIAFSPAIQARYLRLTGTYNSANKGFHVVEWEVYGPPPVPTVETSADSVTVPEGSTATFQARLTTAPANSTTVTVGRVSGDTDIAVQSGTQLVFTATTWSNDQTVTLSAAEDGDETADAATIRCSGPGLADKDVTATEGENDGISNLALASRGSTITGNNGAGWGLLIDGVAAGYTKTAGYGYTYWRNAANAPGRMTLDLKSLCTIAQAKLLLWDLDSRYYRYRIEASANGSTWSTVVNRTTGNWQGWQDIAFSPAIQARYLRLTGTYNSANDGFHVVEWEVYGTLATGPAVKSLVASSGGGKTAAPRPVDVRTSDPEPDTNGWKAVDGDAETTWSGDWLVLAYGKEIEVANVQVLWAGRPASSGEASPTNLLLLGSLDADYWYELPFAEGPLPLSYLWLIFPPGEAAPEVSEIRVDTAK